MMACPDTSFLCALYVQQDNSPAAAAHFQAMPEALHVSGLVLYEFRQSVRFQVFLHAKNKQKGYPQAVADAALANLQANIDSSAVVIMSADWTDVHATAERLSKQHTSANGHRAFDVLHVATALHWSAREFLSFDGNQRKLAAAEGMKAKP
jgi:predicted nucleic acid-binding protein